MKIATWNVNSLRARLDQVVAWLQNSQPDVVLFQETKVQDAEFPKEPLEDLGYNLLIHGQKSYNGVAILSKFPLEDQCLGLPGDQGQNGARYVEAVTNQVRVCSLYVPNGQDVDAPAFGAKCRFLETLEAHLKALRRYDEKIVVGGDFNISPEDIDSYDPEQCRKRLFSTPEERSHFKKLTDLGYTDALRALFPGKPEFYTWWDYRAGSWPRNHGLRIDHFLISPQGAETLTAGGIDLEIRGNPRPSDHAPVWISL